MKNGVIARRMLAKWARENEPSADPKETKVHLRALKARQQRLEKAEEAPPIRFLRIEVNWVKSRMFNRVPEATVSASLADGSYITKETRECGYGYDLTSSAVHGCLVMIPSFDRLVIEAGRKAWDTYAIERDDGFPRLSLRAKGMEALHEFFAATKNWKWSERHGKTWDLYEIEKTSKRK